MLGFGVPPTKTGVGVDLRSLDRVIDYPARDMTITVQTGITVAKLQALLATENQRLPIDVPRADLATLGGTIATNTSGCRRYGFGTLRDYLIGISVVNDEGHEVKAGGRVVKNVAGYDLCKLYIGSLGTLGIITQVTLKLKPRPEEQALLTLGCEAEAVELLLETLHRSRTRPVCLDLLNRTAAGLINGRTAGLLPESPWVVVVGFEDNREAVGWQVQQLIKEVSATCGCTINARAGAVAEPLWQALVEFPLRPEAVLSFKANLLPHAVVEFCHRASQDRPDVRLQAHAGNGIVVGHVEGDLTLEQAQEMLVRLQETTDTAQGNVVITHCPAAWKKTLPVWGRARGDAWLMHAVKDKLDPHRLFNPGRFVDGI